MEWKTHFPFTKGRKDFLDYIQTAYSVYLWLGQFFVLPADTYFYETSKCHIMDHIDMQVALDNWKP